MRTCRYNLPGVLYHCISRFVDREWFFDEPEERERYLFLFGRAIARTDWRCLSYALMSNHIHLAVVAGKSPMESWTKAAHSPFVIWMNARHGRLGPMFADRPDDYQILPENEASVFAYIHNNPVRAGVAKVAAGSGWTSHRAYAGLEKAPTWLHVEEGLARAGMPDPDVFDDWVNRTPGAAFDITFERKRLALRRRGAIEIGTGAMGPDGATFPLMGRPFAHVRPDPRRVIEVVAELSGVAIPVICSRRRIPAACDARLVVVHCGRMLGLTPSDTAASLGISAQAVGAMGRRDIDEYIRIVFDLALERLSIEAWGDRRSASRVSVSNGVPDQVV